MTTWTQTHPNAEEIEADLQQRAERIQVLEAVRWVLTDQRHALEQYVRDNPTSHSAPDAKGALSCAVVTLYREVQELRKPVRQVGEERYSPRGLGSNWLPCFICNPPQVNISGLLKTPEPDLKMDMAAFVDSKESGERVVDMFRKAGLVAKLDFRKFEPNWVQVKVGACEKHEPNLKVLLEETKVRGCIRPAILERVKAVTSG
jgi:hypothetical protein